MYYPYYFHSQSPYGTEIENPFIFEERVRRERIRRELDQGRSGHYYRMTLASFGGRPRVVQLFSMDRDGIVSMRIYRRRQGRWVYHEEYHRDISDMIYLGKYYNVGEYDHGDYEYNHGDYEHRDSCAEGIYYACSPYFNDPFYAVPVYPETDHQVDRNISRKEKGIPLKNFLTPESTSTDMATPESTSTDMATPVSTSTDMATPESTSTDMATPVSTSTNTTIPWIPFSNAMSPSISSKDGPYGDITEMVESTNKFK